MVRKNFFKEVIMYFLKNIIKSFIIGIISLSFVSVVHATDESFSVSLRILTAISITEQSSLTFPDTVADVSSQAVTVAVGDAGAATFDISGEPSEAVTTSIVESSINMVVGSTTVTVDTFTFGGALSGAGAGTLDGSGQLTGAKVGATANIPANPQNGNYAGTLTFRVVYN